MNKQQLLAILNELDDFVCPIIRGRHNPQITVSIPATTPIPYGWRRVQESIGYYPTGTIRISTTLRTEVVR